MTDIKEAFNGKYMDAERFWQVTMPPEAPFHCGEDPNWGPRQAMRYHILAETVNSQQVVYYTRQQLSSLDVSSVTVCFTSYSTCYFTCYFTCEVLALI